MTDLAGASVLVAGASGGLGAPISRQLAAAGALLTTTGRDADRLAALDLDAVAVPADLRKAGAADAVVQRAVDAHGRLDGVVFAAGAVAFAPATETPDQVLVDLFTLNTLAPIRLLRAALSHLQASAAEGREPFVVHISAVVAETPMPGMAAYSATKAALAGFDQAFFITKRTWDVIDMLGKETLRVVPRLRLHIFGQTQGHRAGLRR